MTIAKDFASKLSVAFVAIAMIFLAIAPAVNAAESSEDLQKTINDLLAQVAALQSQVGGGTTTTTTTTTTSTGCNFAMDLKTGSTGADVKALQEFLNSDADTMVSAAGVGSKGMETMYFGPATGAAVSKFQVKYRAEILSPAGLVNPTGFFGPGSRAQANKLCAGTPADDSDDSSDDSDDSSSDLSGEASLEDMTIDSASDDTVEEGDEDAEVAEMTVSFKDGDASISRLDISFQDNDNSSDSWDVLDTLSVWVDGENVGEIDASDKDNYLDEDNGTLRISGLDIVAMEDEDVDVTIAATFQDGIDSDDLDTYDVSVDALRFFDAQGVSDTLDSGDDFGTAVSVTLEEAGADDELIAKTSSEDPTSTTLQVNDDKKSDWYTAFAFDLDTKDSSNDITLNTLVVNVTTDGASSTLAGYSDMVDDVELVIDGVTIDKVTVGGTSLVEGVATLTFDVDGDVTIDAGDRVGAELRLRFKSLNALNEGATVQGSVDSLTTTIVDAEGSDNLGNSQLSGSATGDAHTLRTSGAILEVTDDSTTLKANTDSTLADDEGVFEITFDVTAFESDLYIDDNATRGTVESNTGVNFLITTGGSATTTGTAVATLDSDAELQSGRYLVEEGSTKTFTLTVEHDPAITGSYKLVLYSVNFNDTNADADTQQLATPAEDYDTGSLTI